MSPVNLIGWIGSAAVLTAYLLISMNRLNGTSPIYQLLNLVGSICLIVNTIYYHAYPSAFVNVVWTMIAITALVKSRLSQVA